jgi:hypothetical protein
LQVWYPQEPPDSCKSTAIMIFVAIEKPDKSGRKEEEDEETM